MSQSPLPSAFNTMPSIVVALFAIILGVETWFAAGTLLIGGPEIIEWRVKAIEKYAVPAELFPWMIENNQYPLEHLARFVSFSFINKSMINTAIACALFLAMGKMVGSVFSSVAVLILFVGSAATGATIYSLIVLENSWLFGSLTGIYGLIGAYTFIMWITLRRQNAPQKQAFYLIFLIMGIQLFFGIIFEDNKSWIADLISSITGFSLSFLFFPGGLSKVLDLLRKS